MAARLRPSGKKRGGPAGKNDYVREARRKVLQQKCLELRIQGFSLSAIAAELFAKQVTPKKLATSTIGELITDALDQVVVPEAEKLKKLELERLDNIINGHYGNAVNGDVAATHALLACVDRRCRLLGIGQEHKVSSQTLGADGKPVGPIRPVINLTIARPAVEADGANGKLIESTTQLLPLARPEHQS